MKEIFTLLLLIAFNLSIGQSNFKNLKCDSKVLHFVSSSVLDDSLQSQCTEVIIDEKRYNAIDEIEIEVLSIRMVENCLKLKLKHPGNQDSNISLIDAGWIKESYPPQRGLKLDLVKHKSDKEDITKDYYFDISKLLGDAKNGEIIFHIRNRKFKIEY